MDSKCGCFLFSPTSEVAVILAVLPFFDEIKVAKHIWDHVATWWQILTACLS
jgi:hypothetical protein